MTQRRLVGICLAVALGAIPTAAGPPGGPPVRTLLEVQGTIEGFAQDGRYITWANPTPAYSNPRACSRIVQLRDLHRKKTWSLVAKKSSLCGEITRLGGFQHRMALAGTRALWGNVTASNSSDHVSIHTASRGGRSRSLDTVSTLGGLEADLFRPVPMAGDGPSLVFAQTGNSEGQSPYGVARVGRGGRTTRLTGTEYTSAVAVQGGRTLLARSVREGCRCDHGPAWSPNGEQIAFASGRGEGGVEQRGLHVMQPDGSGLRVLPVGKGIWTVKWSPDGSKLAFERVSFGNLESGSIFVAGADGRGLRRVGTGFQPAWSPDGRSLAFTRSGSPYSVFRASATGGAPKRISAGTNPDWSPDGSRLVVTRRDGLYIVGANGTGARRLVAKENTVGGWSRDGRLIAYSRDYGGEGTWVVAPDGTGRRRLSSSAVFVEWAPDSRSILGLGEDMNIVVIAADGSGERRIFAGEGPTWSPDGTAVAFVESPGDIARIGTDGSDRRVLSQATPAPGRNVIELRATTTGRVLKSFNTDRLPTEVALAGSRTALLYTDPSQLEVRMIDGTILRQVPLVGAENLSLSGRWAVYRTGRTIRAFDIQSGSSMMVARAAAYPVGLSLDGRRVAWAEQRRRTSRIRAAVLPP